MGKKPRVGTRLIDMDVVRLVGPAGARKMSGRRGTQYIPSRAFGGITFVRMLKREKRN